MPFLKRTSYEIPRSRQLEGTAKLEGWRNAVYTPEKDVYVGEWGNNKKNGFGALLRKEWLHEGYWRDNKKHGFGVTAVEDKDKVFRLCYRGMWNNNESEGFGEKHYKKGGCYRGAMKNGKRHGNGQMWYSNGAFYDGEWWEGARHGSGMYVYVNGNRYEGPWKKDKRHGMGRYFNLRTGRMQEGVWTNNVCVTSTVEEIPFKQTASDPCLYLIRPNELLNLDRKIKEFMNIALYKNEWELHGEWHPHDRYLSVQVESIRGSTKSTT